jgi:hypothetical protein
MLATKSLDLAFKALAFLNFPNKAAAARAVEARSENSNHWVATWTSMPQIVEPNNLPPTPFVCHSVSRYLSLLPRDCLGQGSVNRDQQDERKPAV